MSTTNTALADFGRIRDSRHHASLRRYREIIATIASGDAEPSAFAQELDDVMLQLQVSDEELAQDVTVTQERWRRQAKASSDERHDLAAQLPGLDAKQRKAEKAFQVAERRLDEATDERRSIGLQVQRFRDNDAELKKLEAANPRIFSPLPDDDA